MAIREGAWDCPQCGRVRNRGPEKHCAGCGHPRGAEVPFYLPEDAPEVTDAAALRHARAGPDWTCTYCDGDNRADADYCTGCGASRDGAPPRPVIEHRDEPGAVATPGPVLAAPPETAVPPLPPADRSRQPAQGSSSEPPAASKKPAQRGCGAGCGRLSGTVGCLVLLLFAVLAVIAGLQAPGPGPEPTRLPPEDPAGQQMLEEPDPLGQWIPEQPVSRSRGDQAEEAGDSRSWWQRLFGAPEGLVTVTGHRWSRTVEVERLTPQVRETWRDQVPSGGEILEVQERVRDRERIQIGTEEKVRTYTERVQVGTERVKVGTRDLGNGYFEDIYEKRPVYENVERREVRSVPVYREEPIYDQWARYRIGRWERVRTKEAGGIDRAPGWPPVHLAAGEREGRRRESYSVVFRDEEGRERIYTTDREDEWRSFEVGEQYRAKLRGSDRVSAVVERVGVPAPSGRGSG